MSELLRGLLADLPAPDEVAAAAVRSRAENVLRPAGALQRLDDAAVHIAGWHGTERPEVTRPGVVVFAGDHGVTAAGVSAYPSEITAAMLAAVQAGRAIALIVARPAWTAASIAAVISDG